IRRRAHVPAIDILERRVLPAGTLTTTFAAGLLTITAADSATVAANNNQDINVMGTGPGVFSLSGNGGETFAGAGAGPFVGVANIKLDMKLGNDTVTVTTAQLSGALTFLGGDGNNTCHRQYHRQ